VRKISVAEGYMGWGGRGKKNERKSLGSPNLTAQKPFVRGQGWWVGGGGVTVCATYTQTKKNSYCEQWQGAEGPCNVISKKPLPPNRKFPPKKI